jgi:hypoxanthine phosphoribosyltransferase
MYCSGVTNVDGNPTIMGWERVTQLSTDLSKHVRTDGIPDIVVGVLRGGMIPAVLVCHSLGLRDLRAVDVTHTLDDQVNAAKTAHPTLRRIRTLGPLDGADVLVVDDIAGSGATIVDVAELARRRNANRVRTAVCVLNRANWTGSAEPHQVLNYVGATVEGWVIFPWEHR